MSNTGLVKAWLNKNDEFYTRYEDVEKECSLYSKQFEDKIIYLPMDNKDSAFWKYFINNFHDFKLKKLVASHLSSDKYSYILTYDGYNISKTEMEDNGDFFKETAQSILETCDIVVSNPPFSLERDIICSIVKKNKDFLLIAAETLSSRKEIFLLFKENKIRFGKNSVYYFVQPDGQSYRIGNVKWLTTLESPNEKKVIPTTTLQEKIYYDNYDAIEISKTKDIPSDYFGVMGVPITYLKYHNPDLFDILGIACSSSKSQKLYGEVAYHPTERDKSGDPMINGKRKFSRVFIKRKT